MVALERSRLNVRVNKRFERIEDPLQLSITIWSHVPAVQNTKGCFIKKMFPHSRHCTVGTTQAGGPLHLLVLSLPQLGAESADSIGAVLHSKDELKEIEETRETCR